MPVDDFRKKVNQLTPKVKEILLSNKTFEIISGTNTRYSLNPKQQEKVALIVGKIFIKELPLNELANTLKIQTNISSETAKLITIDIAKDIFLPIKQYFPTVENLINQLRGQQNLSGSPNIIDLKNK